MKPLTLQEAADFLRMSRSSLYQRKDIPRFRRPGSRVMLFDQDELEAWVRTGRVEARPLPAPAAVPIHNTLNTNCLSISIPNVSTIDPLDIQNSGIYHRNARYR